MEENKCEEEILAEVYRNAQLAITSISDLLPEVDDGEMREELMRQHEEYERICSEAAKLSGKMNIELKEPSPIKKAMMWSAIKMNAGTDNSRSNVAQMMIKGTVNGITSLKTSLSERERNMSDEIHAIASDLIGVEENFEKRLKRYL